MPNDSYEDKVHREFSALMAHYRDGLVSEAIASLDVAEERLRAVLHRRVQAPADQRAKVEQALKQVSWLRQTLLTVWYEWEQPPEVHGPAETTAEDKTGR